MEFIRADKNLNFNELIPKKFLETTNSHFGFCGSTITSFDSWYGYMERLELQDITKAVSHLIHWNNIMMYLPDVEDYVEVGCTLYGINRGAYYRILCILLGLLDENDKVVCNTLENRLYYIYIMNQFELFSREKLLLLYQLSEIWDYRSQQHFRDLAQHSITKSTMTKCHNDVKNKTNEYGCNYMLDPIVDVRVIADAFRNEFREEFLINHAEMINSHLAYPEVRYF
jgi:hypothetical protein